MKKREENTVEERFIKGDLIRSLREEGFKISKPIWPKYLLISPVGKIIFAEIKMAGGRVSKRQLSTLTLLKQLGMGTVIIYKKGSVRGEGMKEKMVREQLLKKAVTWGDKNEEMFEELAEQKKKRLEEGIEEGDLL